MEIDVLKFIWGVSEPLFYILIGGAATLGLYKLYQRKVKDKFNKLPCETHQATISSLPCADHTKLFGEIKEDLAYIKGAFLSKIEDPFMKKQSPISLTEKGEALSEELLMREIVDNNWDKIHSDLEENLIDKNPYDIQEYCLETAGFKSDRFFTEKDIVRFKTKAFQKGLNVVLLYRIAGILIRDKYLTEKGINIKDIDNHDPSVQKQ